MPWSVRDEKKIVKWGDLLKDEEEARRGLAGGELAKSTPKLPPELEEAKVQRHLYIKPSEAVFKVEGPHGSVLIECGIRMTYLLVDDAFKSIGLTMEQAREQLASKYDISMQHSTSPSWVKFVHLPKGTVRCVTSGRGQL